MLEIGLGLHYLHSMGIVHGYLHGVSIVVFRNCLSLTYALSEQANILLDENRHARLSDFGIVTEPDQLKHGCMRCMAPEIFVNQKDGPKIVKDTDVYAFASVYYKVSHVTFTIYDLIDNQPSCIKEGGRIVTSDETVVSGITRAFSAHNMIPLLSLSLRTP